MPDTKTTDEYERIALLDSIMTEEAFQELPSSEDVSPKVNYLMAKLVVDYMKMNSPLGTTEKAFESWLTIHYPKLLESATDEEAFIRAHTAYEL